MSAWMHKVTAYLAHKGKDSYPQPWLPLSKRLRFFSSQDLRGFCDLPIELVLHIISYIQSDLDRLCLALTCKSLLEIIDCWPVPAEFRESTRALPTWIYGRYYPMHKISRDRWELLRRLENAHWRRCMGCYKLHPVDEFRKLDLWTPANQRTCIFGKLVGVVRLCPCIEMTFRDKMRITKELIRLQQQEQQPKQQESGSEAQQGNGHNRGLLPGFDPVTGQHQCLYQCHDNWHRGRSIKVQRKLKFILDEDHNLILETEYKVTEMESNPNDSLGTLLLCPHIQVLKGIHNIEYMKDWPSARFTRLPSGRMETKQSYPGSFSCPWCEMTIFNVQERRETFVLRPRDLTFTTRRCLGNDIEKADNIWYRQTETSIENQHWPQRQSNAYYRRTNVMNYHEPSQ